MMACILRSRKGSRAASAWTDISPGAGAISRSRRIVVPAVALRLKLPFAQPRSRRSASAGRFARISCILPIHAIGLQVARTSDKLLLDGLLGKYTSDQL